MKRSTRDNIATLIVGLLGIPPAMYVSIIAETHLHGVQGYVFTGLAGLWLFITRGLFPFRNDSADD
jgi:hypothetical protein